MAIPQLSKARLFSEKTARSTLIAAFDFSRLHSVLRELFAVELEGYGFRESFSGAESLGAESQLTLGPLLTWLSVDPALATLLLSRLMSRQVNLAKPGPLSGGLLGAWHALVDQILLRLSRGEPPGLPTDLALSPADAGFRVDFWLRLDGVSYRGQALMQATSAALPSEVGRAASLIASPLPVRLGLVLACTPCDRETLSGLELGDAFIPESWLVNEHFEGEGVLCAARGEHGIQVALSLRNEAGGSPKTWTLTVKGPATLPLEPKAAPVERKKEETMNSEADTFHDAVADAPVLVRVELGAVTMSAREWVALSAGDVIGIGVPLNQPVTLRVAGQQVAEGELVNIDGELGVRVTKLS